MADAREHAAIVFAALIPGRKDLLDRALAQLTPNHFNDPAQKNFWKMVDHYASNTGGVLTELALTDMLRSFDAGKRALYEQMHDTAFKRTVSDDDFAWSMLQLRELAAEQATQDALSGALQILRQGREDEHGELRQGQEEARAFLMESLSSIDQDLLHASSPEGDIQDDEDDLLADYERRKADFQAGINPGIRFGLTELDQKVGGLQPGDLVLVAGYSSDGKSSMMVQLAWSAAMEQGKNVLLFTTETVRSVMRRKLVSRHSKQPAFGLREGINTRDYKAGSLPMNEEVALRAVISDLSHNPGYGRVRIVQVPRGSTIGSLEQRALSAARGLTYDLIVIDYLALLATDARRNTDRESLSGILRAAKVFATTFDNGKGVPIVSPWQVNRASREQALRDGSYSSSALAETAEATNSSDVILSLLAPAENTGRYAELKAQVLKNRDGETSSPMLLDVDYATSAFTTKASISFDTFAPASGGSGLDDLYG